MAKKPKKYPDVSHLLASHEADRRKLAALSWEEKVAMIERMRDDLNLWRRRRYADAVKKFTTKTRRTRRGL